jgi:ATP-dependent Clp protease adaptor protein ClpS
MLIIRLYFELTGQLQSDDTALVDALPPALSSSGKLVIRRVFSFIEEVMRIKFGSYFPESLDQPDVVTSGTQDGEYYSLFVHNDDVHSFDHVINAIIAATACSRLEAHQFTTAVDAEGSAVVSKGTRAKCKQAMLELVGRGLLASALPYSHMDKERRAILLLEWLKDLSSKSSTMMTLICDVLVGMGPLQCPIRMTRNTPVGSAMIAKASRLCRSVSSATIRSPRAAPTYSPNSKQQDDVPMEDVSKDGTMESLAPSDLNAEEDFSRDIGGANCDGTQGGDQLCRAVISGESDLVKSLVRRGANIFVRRQEVRQGSSVLYLAARGGSDGGSTETDNQVECVKYLLQCCPPEKLRDFVEATTDRRLFTAIFAAASEGKKLSIVLREVNYLLQVV